jgi:hypothetical protein
MALSLLMHATLALECPPSAYVSQCLDWLHGHDGNGDTMTREFEICAASFPDQTTTPAGIHEDCGPSVDVESKRRLCCRHGMPFSPPPPPKSPVIYHAHDSAGFACPEGSFTTACLDWPSDQLDDDEHADEQIAAEYCYQSYSAAHFMRVQQSCNPQGTQHRLCCAFNSPSVPPAPPYASPSVVRREAATKGGSVAKGVSLGAALGLGVGGIFITGVLVGVGVIIGMRTMARRMTAETAEVSVQGVEMQQVVEDDGTSPHIRPAEQVESP